MSSNLKALLFILGGLFCLSPYCSAGIGLIIGISLTTILTNPWADKTTAIYKKLLPLVVVCMGAGINISSITSTAIDTFFLTFVGVVTALSVGVLLGRLLSCDRATAVLISVGTAICGGSAIAAVAPILKAKSEALTVSIAVVFVLNSIGLLLFPFLGDLLQLTEHQFGLWSAVAIHDTSSVVGAAMQYGPVALEVGTTTKLVRTIWILPVALLFSLASSTESRAKVKTPWFILGFLAMSLLVSLFPELEFSGQVLSTAAKRVLVFVLYLIGLSLSVSQLRAVGAKPILLGIVLWVIVSAGSLAYIKWWMVK